MHFQCTGEIQAGMNALLDISG